MLVALDWILSTAEAFGELVLWALATFTNELLTAVGLTVVALFSLLPTMSSAPELGTPTWLRWLSWFYPVGDLLAGLTTLVGLWVAFLAVRYLLRLLRAI